MTRKSCKALTVLMIRVLNVVKFDLGFCNRSGAASFFTPHSHAFVGGCSNFYEETLFAGQAQPGGK